jgi:two-component SAPR family response regulator
MYRGTFLGNEADLPWASSAKERWRGKYVAHVSELGRRLVATGAVEEALTTYLGALEVEDLAEPIYQDAMRCCLELSRRSEGLLLHRRLRVALSAGLGVAPDAVSEALRRSLTEA